jgi:hypothetical protein
MNCKQGDLAIVVRSVTGLNLGKIVRCVRWVGYSAKDPVTGGEWADPADDNWEIDPPLSVFWRVGIYVGESTLCRDSCLRPLRGDLLDNETETGRELVHAR